MRATTSRRVGWGLAALFLAAVALILWLRGQDRDDDGPQGATPGDAPPPAGPPPPPGTSAPGTGLPGPPPALVSDSAALHARLGEEAVPVASDVVVTAIERERDWVCAGKPLGLAARVAGAAPGAVQRWIWRTPDGAVALHPGGAIEWAAPDAPGPYRVHFQVCTDLGGRRIGVLAERAIDLEVRACADGEDPGARVRIAVSQRGHGVFAFAAAVADEVRGEAPITGYAWDFGDGTSVTTTGPSAEHAYALAELAADEVARFSVRLTVQRASGGPLTATTNVLVRGFPEPRTEGPVAVEIARWQLDPAGKRWQSAITVRPREGQTVTWDQLERITKLRDDRVDIATLDWRAAIDTVIEIDEHLPGGGFRGRVVVPVAQAPPDVKQIIDVLHGHGPDNGEITVSWSPFKRMPDAAAPGATPGATGDVPGK